LLLEYDTRALRDPFSLVVAAAAVVMVVVGAHSDRTGERRWHVAIAAVVAAVALSFAGYAENIAWLVVAFSVAMIGVQSMNGPFWAMPSKLFSGAAAAVGIALINSVGNLGSGFGPYWIGHLRNANGNFRAGLLSVAGILALAALVVLLASRPDKVEFFQNRLNKPV